MKVVFAAITALFSSAVLAASGHPYTLSKSISLGAPDRWDYVTFNGPTKRIYVAHGNRLAVIDAASEKVVGEVEGITGGTHGAAVSLATNQGFTDDGRNGKAVAFNLKTLKISKEIPANVDADALVLDPSTGHLFVIEGDPESITVVDPKTDSAIATIKAGVKLEFAVADGEGAIFVAGESNGDVLKINTRSNQIVSRWKTQGCVSPHGIAVDPKAHRAFMGCSNSVLMVVDTLTGRTVARLPIGKGSDAVAFDPVRKRVFSSNGS
ncbi:MAG TPA: YncE family protein, partial [Sphingomicrobium sp.]|nr:YncE family protein [Sphingomicrobium sp.]